MKSVFFLLALPLTCLAHFNLVYPPARGFDENLLVNFPCGSQPLSTNRTVISTKSFPMQLLMGHDQAAVQVLLGLGTNPGSNFNITLEHTFREEGLGNFCLPDVPFPSGMAGVENGMNATIQVITNGDPNGGLYNCADITFTTGTPPAPSQCSNGTGVSATPFPSAVAALNANESSPQGQPQNGAGASGSASGSMSVSATGSATAVSTSKTGAGIRTEVVGWSLMAVVGLGTLAVL